MKGLALIASHTELLQIILDRRWEQFFKKRTLERGQRYVLEDRIQKFTIDQVGDTFSVTACVRGSYKSHYNTEIDIFPGLDVGWYLVANCDCPVGDDCKHAAALFAYLTTELQNPSAQGPAKDRTLHEFDAWLTSIEVPQASAPEPEKKKSPVFLAYCVQLSSAHYKPVLKMRLHTGRYLKNGTLRIDLRSSPTAQSSRPASYMQQADHLPSDLFHQIQRATYYDHEGISLIGPMAGILLEQALSTGRLYYLDEQAPPTSLKLQPPAAPQPVWKKLEEGKSAPSFAPPFDGPIHFVETEPAYLIVPGLEEASALYPLKSSTNSLSFLKSWMSGPVLDAEAVNSAVTRLQKVAPSLPRPEPTETKQLSKKRPSISLSLTRVNPYTHGGLHLSGHAEPVIAMLNFRYHGHDFTPDLNEEPLGEASFLATKKDVVYTIPRDTTVERDTILKLVNEHQLVPAGVHDLSIDRDYRAALVPRERPAIWEQEMAVFMTSSIPQLREEGWVIKVDTSAKIEVHAIGPDELDTGLAEAPDHGIDWFQFSASYLTPEGNEQPLLPLLGSYLEHLDFETIQARLDVLPEGDQTVLKNPDAPNSYLALPTRRLLLLAKTLHDLFGGTSLDEPIHKLQAAGLADALEMDGSQTLKDLAFLGQNLKNITSLPKARVPASVNAELRDYQLEGFQWMQFLARHSLHGILADDMGLGKTLQALTHLQSEVSGRRTGKRPSLVLAPTSVVANWKNEAAKFTPKLKTLLLHGPERKEHFKSIPKSHLVITSYALLVRDFSDLKKHDFHLVVLDEAQYIKNPAAKVSQLVCQLSSNHRLSLSGTPLENHLGELWSQMRFLMPGLLGSSEAFRKHFRTPIEKYHDGKAQLALNSRVAPLILRRTKDQVATELPPKTEIIHTIALNDPQTDLYETVRAAMDDRIRDTIAAKGLAKSHIIVLDALLKLRQICCHPQLLKLGAAKKVKDSAKLDFLTMDLMPTLLEEGRKILIFSTFTSMLALIEEHLKKKKITFSKITGSTKNRQKEIDQFQNGETSVFLISLKAGGTGLNLTAADTVIHYDPWWNPAAENQATDRAYRIGQDKPVFVHKLISEGTIEQRILELQQQKAKLVEALLSEETTKLKLDQETLGNLLSPIEV